MQREEELQRQKNNEEILTAIVQMAANVKGATIYTVEQRNALIRAQQELGVPAKRKRLYSKTMDRAVVVCALLNGMTYEEVTITLDTIRAAINVARDESPITLPGFAEKPVPAKEEEGYKFKIY